MTRVTASTASQAWGVSGLTSSSRRRRSPSDVHDIPPQRSLHTGPARSGTTGLDRCAAAERGVRVSVSARPTVGRMDGTSALPASGIGTTALGRLQLRVPESGGGHDEVVVERRWPDMASARSWCERTIARAAPGTEVLEVQVFAESWWRARSWQAERHRPVAEMLQLGVLDAQGRVRWAEPRSMSPRAGARLPS